MAFGLPIIAANVGGIPYVVGSTAVLVKPTDVEALKRAIALFCNESNRKAYQKLSLERVKLFTWESVVDGLEKYIGEFGRRG